MSDHERGAYTPPTEGGLAFDARQPVRGARPVPFTLIISVLVLAALVAAIFVFYRQGVRGAGEPPQTVGTSIDGMSSAAPPEAQPQDPAAGLEIYRPDATDPTTSVPQFTAPPEQPQARGVQTPVVVAPPAVVAPAPAPAASTPAMRPTLPAPAATTPPMQKAIPAPTPKAPVVKAPEPKPVEPKATEAKAEPKAAPAKGGVSAQVGAVTSTELADKTWNEAIKASGGLGSGKGKAVEKVERDGKTLYRTGVTGFASRADAQAFCAKLQGAGKACFVR